MVVAQEPSLVAQGAYGCVFDPPLRCEGDAKVGNAAVGKVFPDPSHAENEARAMEIVRKIDPKGRYTVPMRLRCDVVPTSRIRTACSLLARNRDKPRLDQLVYPRAGQDLARFVEAHPDFEVLDMVDGMANVMEGIRVLAAKGYCHRDMKPSNLMVESRGRKMRITDFGMMCPFDKLYAPDQSYVLAFNYEYYPPEFKIYYDHALVSLEHVADPTLFIAQDVRVNYLESPLQFFADVADVRSVVTDVLSNVAAAAATPGIPDSPQDALRKGLESMAEKVDVFGAGASFARLFDVYEKKTDSAQRTALLAALYDTINACTDLNPLTRLDAASARDRFRAIARRL